MYLRVLTLKHIILAALAITPFCLLGNQLHPPKHIQSTHTQTVQPTEKPKVALATPVLNNAPKLPEKAPEVASIPAPTPKSTCESEIKKYDWNHQLAYAVMMAESGGDPNQVNDNPRTGDYSIGCFQVNLYGANARTRPPESELKKPEVNVKWSYGLYVAKGRTFAGSWGAFNTGAYRRFL